VEHHQLLAAEGRSRCRGSEPYGPSIDSPDSRIAAEEVELAVQRYRFLAERVAEGTPVEVRDIVR
jgi:hypothetical protein